MTTLIISNKEMNNTIIIVKSLEESALLIKGTSETIKNLAKEQKEKICNMLLESQLIRKPVSRQSCYPSW